MVGSKSTQTRFVGMITSTVHPYACFLGEGNQAGMRQSKLIIPPPPMDNGSTNGSPSTYT